MTRRLTVGPNRSTPRSAPVRPAGIGGGSKNSFGGMRSTSEVQHGSGDGAGTSGLIAQRPPRPPRGATNVQAAQCESERHADLHALASDASTVLEIEPGSTTLAIIVPILTPGGSPGADAALAGAAESDGDVAAGAAAAGGAETTGGGTAAAAPACRSKPAMQHGLWTSIAGLFFRKQRASVAKMPGRT